MPVFDPSKDYYNAYWELYMQNEQLMAELNNESTNRDDELLKILQIESFYHENVEKMQGERYLHNGRKKHNRRTAQEICRDFKCPYETCGKLYGSEGSLNLHIKIKHNGGNKTDREKIAKSIVYAKASGISLPNEIICQSVNLPPGSIEQAAE